MKKLIALLASAVCMLSLAACGGGGGGQTLPPDTNVSESNILITYFTWADNITPFNPDEVDTSLSTSASVIAPGNAAIIAGYIHDAVGGELFSVRVTDPYPSNYDECLDRAADERACNARPELANRVDNMDDYDIVFIGYPNWWYTVPMAIHSFAESYNFSGKTVIPFCAHGTGGLAGSVRDLRSSLGNGVTFIDNAFGVYRPDTVGCRPQVNEWLAELGFEVGNEG